MTVDAHPPRLRAASRLGRTAAAPIASAKGGRDSFAGDVRRPVDAAREQAVPAGTIPASIPLPTEVRLLLPRWVVSRQGIAIQEAGLAGVARLRQEHPDPHQLG